MERHNVGENDSPTLHSPLWERRAAVVPKRYKLGTPKSNRDTADRFDL